MTPNDALLAACRRGDVTAVEDAAARGADLHCYGDQPMYYAATRGHHAVVTYLVLHAPAGCFHVGAGALRAVARMGDTAMLARLLAFATPAEVASLKRQGLLQNVDADVRPRREGAEEG